MLPRTGSLHRARRDMVILGLTGSLLSAIPILFVHSPTLAAIRSPLAFGMIIDVSGSWLLPFVAPMLLLAIGGAATFWMRPEAPFAAGAMTSSALAPQLA